MEKSVRKNIIFFIKYRFYKFRSPGITRNLSQHRSGGYLHGMGRFSRNEHPKRRIFTRNGSIFTKRTSSGALKNVREVPVVQVAVVLLELLQVVLLVPQRHLVVVEDSVHERDEDRLGCLRLLPLELVRRDARTERRLGCRVDGSD